MSVATGPLPRRIAPVDRAFLPAALEIIDTPASPTARLTGMLICLFLVIVVAWATIGQVDLIATAPGKVVPVGRTKQVQAFETGVIRQILVDDGMSVRAGQPLILLDPTLAAADRDRFREQLMRASIDIARLTALISGVAQVPASADPFAGIEAPAEAISGSRGRLAADRAGREAKLAGADREIASKRAEKAEDEAEIAKIDASLPLVQERAQIRKSSSQQKWGSRIDYLTAAQAEVELTNQRKVMLEKVSAADAAIQAQIADRQQIAAETERDWRSDLDKAARDKAEASSELAKAERRTGLTSVVAPIDGIIENVSVHTEGGVVQAGQQLLKVVPVGGAVAIEAIVENKDVGFVRAGQEVEIKVDAFPYTRHGLIRGRVERIARDAAPDPELMQQGRTATEPPGEEPTDLRRSSGLVYVARIAMEEPSLLVDGIKTPIEPGMAVTVEIRTGRRRVIDYILSPIAQHTHDALRER